MEEFISTSKLIAATEKEIGVAGMPDLCLSRHKLLRWQKDGLLPEQQTCGAGPGKRQESLWHKNCVERLLVIIGGVKEKRLNRKDAELALIANGFGVRGDILRKHFLAMIKQMTAELQKQQRTKCKDLVDQADKVERSTKDRMSTHGVLVKEIFAGSHLGYRNLYIEAEHFKAIAELANFFRPEALQEMIEKSEPEQLELAYQNPSVIFCSLLMTSIVNLMCGRTKGFSMPGITDNDLLAQAFINFAPKPNGKLRRKKPYPYSEELVRYNMHMTAMIFYLMFNQNKTEFSRLITNALNEVLISPEFKIPESFKYMLNIRELEESDALFGLFSMPK
ncbi:MAG: hypothetical protein NMNS01_25950 [Nitrosomonas sp.]|nr:MAG: hypothetical protein NMNS01_25950 [Nitrosomonas sp.]